MAKTRPSYEVKVYIGSVNEQTRRSFNKQSLVEEIGRFQDENRPIIPVRICDTTFISGLDYNESGWEISAINYPKIKCDPETISSFMLKLAENLVEVFHQHRICVITPHKTIMISKE